MINILYKDKYLLLCQKPVGIPSQKDMAGGENLLDLLSQTNPYVGLVHRLDTHTGGVMMYSLDKSATGKLSALVSDHEAFVKEYIAISEGIPEGFPSDARDESYTMEDELYHDKLKNKSFTVDRPRGGSKKARLVCRLISSVEDEDGNLRALWLVRLYTGRTHQIRVQFASRCAPLLGDGKYGGREKRATTALWSYRVNFKHPVTRKEVSASVLPDTDTFPWNLFSKETYEKIDKISLK